MARPFTAGTRAGLAVAVLGLTGVGVFGVGAPPEHCPSVDPASLRASATRAVDWFVRNQHNDGTWLYEYDADEDTATPGYNVVRHAGAISGLYQAATFEVAGARESADRGLAWVSDHLIERDDWAAVRNLGEVSTGASALLASGLVERRLDTGDRQYDELLRRLGRFLVAQTEPSGAVLAYYDDVAGKPVAGLYSKYYTGESYWALARLHRLFPAGEWGEVADRIGRYLATERDEREDHWPPIPDHWAAYGLAETTEFPDRDRERPLTAAEVAYAEAQAGSFGAQVRWLSQRAGPWGAAVRGPMVPRGGGYGVNSEALTHLWVAAGADPRLADLQAPVAERALCVAGLAIDAQSDASEAATKPSPDRVEGAWFRDGVTRMDDQQHALSGLLATIPIAQAEDAPHSTTGRQAPSWWLWLVVLVAAFNPFRLVQSLPRRSRSVVASGGAVGGAGVLLVASTSGPLLDVLNVSGPALRVAATAVGIAAAVLALTRRPVAVEPALDGWRAALVPIAVPLVATPALVLLALSADADKGFTVVLAALALSIGALAGVCGREGLVIRWGGRFLSALLLAGCVLLLIDGVLAV